MNLVRAGYGSMVERLARVTTSGRRIRELDGLRFIAVSTVIMQHVGEQIVTHYKPGPKPPDDLFTTLILDARIGVALFFVISGFILALPFATQRMCNGAPVSLKAYYRRRITRLETPYLLALAICYAMAVFYWHEPARSQFPHLMASVFYLHNIFYHGANYMSPINAVTWSLEVEVQFYIVAPFLAFVFVLNHKWQRRGLLVAVSIINEQSFKLLGHFGIASPVTIFNELPEFLMGFLLADLYLTDWNQQPRGSLWGDLIAIPGWLLLPLWFELVKHGLHGYRVASPSAFCFVLFVLCWASFRSVYTRKLLASSAIMTIGGMCYSIYLVHLPLIGILANYSPVPLFTRVQMTGANTLIYTVVWGIPVLAISAVFFLLVEKPCMRKDWPQRLWAFLRRKPIPGVSTVVSPSEAEAILDVPPSTTLPLSENQPVP